LPAGAGAVQPPPRPGEHEPMSPREPDHTREPATPVRAISLVEIDIQALFEEHYDDIASYLTRRLVDRATAEDIAQTTFLEAYDRQATFDPRRGTPRGWLFGIASNLMRRHFRTERRRLEAYARAASRQVSPPDGWDELYNRVDADASAGAIASALATLSLRDYEVVSLHCWAELSHDEIATALGIPTGTVKSRLNRARRRLRTALDPQISEKTDDG
jgi:RNA polymerase sigma-70 factor (ECF subfamily)